MDFEYRVFGHGVFGYRVFGYTVFGYSVFGDWVSCRLLNSNSPGIRHGQYEK